MYRPIVRRTLPDRVPLPLRRDSGALDEATVPVDASLLVSAVRQLSDAATLDGVVDIVRRTARHLVGADGATVVLRDGSECHYVDEDAIAPLWKGRRFPIEACISGWSMRYRQQAIVPDVYDDARIPQDAYRPTFVRSLVMTPVDTGEPWAAIGVYWARTVVPTPEQARCLQALADSTALAMQNVRMRTQLDRAAIRVAEAADDQNAPVTMCAWTRRIRWNGSWVSVEQFLHERFGLDVTHGISDEAAKDFEQAAGRWADAGEQTAL